MPEIPQVPLPDRAAMESWLALVTGDRRQDAIEKAQNLACDDWEEATARGRVAGARKALALCPVCADAFNILAQEARTLENARDLYVLGVEAGELALGPVAFERSRGEFWSVFETRPYMRARHGLALILFRLGEDIAAIAHCRAMLALNPNDNQGIRYLLLGALLRRGEIDALKALLADYDDEGSPTWLYTRLLLAFREGRADASLTTHLLKAAHAANPHLPAILAGTAPPTISSTGYVTAGGPDEASDYVRECGPAWQQTPGAIEWLTAAC